MSTRHAQAPGLNHLQRMTSVGVVCVNSLDVIFWPQIKEGWTQMALAGMGEW
jgi:hypothetical protein